MTPLAYEKLRRAIGTQAEVAGLLGVDRTTILRRESGEIELTVEAVLAIQQLAQLYEPGRKPRRKRP